MQFGRTLILASALAISTFAAAHDAKIGNLHIERAVARTTVPGQPSGAAYLSIENRGKTGDKLVSVDSPIAKSAQIHTMAMEGNMMKMREVDGIDLKPGSTIAMEPGNGYHIMLFGLKQPLKAGDTFPLMLTFEKAGKLKVSTTVVQDVASGMEMKGQDHMDMKK
jgi:hypothetical protein